MKKYIIVIAFILTLITVCFAVDSFFIMDSGGNRVNPGQSFTLQETWHLAGTFLSADAEPTTPDSTHRTYALMGAVSKAVIYDIEPQWNSIVLRCASTTDGDTTVFDVFLARGEDNFHRVATLTFTTGTQTSPYSGYELADTCVASNAQWHKTASVLSPTGNYIAEWAVDVMGCSKIAFVPTTLTNNAKLEITGY